jgi:AraC-like DNA-binding protein
MAVRAPDDTSGSKPTGSGSAGFNTPQPTLSAVRVAPMEYLLAWRMALAKSLLRRKEAGVAEVAERVGYSSASTFSVAFARHVGVPPMRYARDQAGR